MGVFHVFKILQMVPNRVTYHKYASNFLGYCLENPRKFSFFFEYQLNQFGYYQ